MLDWYYNFYTRGELFYTIIDVEYCYHAFTYIPDQHWSKTYP